MKRTMIKRWCSIALMAAVLASCDDEQPEPPPDLEVPVITIQAPIDKSIVYAVTRIEATAEDNDGIANVKVFVDNATVPVQEFTTESVIFDWNTRTLSDGTHSIKFIATDEAGNIAEVQKTYTVKNTLLKFTVPYLYIVLGSVYYIIVSDHTGKVWDSKPLLDDDIYTFMAPDGFAGQNLTMTLVRFIGPTNTQCYLYTYPSIPFGEYAYIRREGGPSDPFIGYGTVRITGITNLSALRPVSTETTSLSSLGTGVPGLYEIKTRNNDAVIIFTDNRNGVLYNLVRTVEPGHSYEYALSEFVPNPIKTVAVPDDGPVILTVNAKSAAYGDIVYFNSQRVNRVAGGGINVPMLPLDMISYSVSIATDVGNNPSHRYYLNSPSLPETMKTLPGTVDCTRKENTITVNKSADVDFLTFSTGSPFSASATNISWYVNSSAEAASYTLPQIPRSIAEAHNIGMTSYGDYASAYGSNYAMNEYTHYSGYSDFLDKQFNPNSTIGVFTEYKIKTVTLENGSNGGRVAAVDPDQNP